MNISIVSKKVELTEDMKDHIEMVIEQLQKYSLDLVAVKVVVRSGKNHHKPVINVEFTIQLAHRDTIVIKQVDKDFHAACDIAVERAKKVLRRYHDKIKDKIHSGSNEHKAESDVPEVYSDLEEDIEIIPTDLEIHKPMDPEEALEYFKGHNLMFMVFNDHDGKRRVLYRRKDGRFGLY
jgi:putative sigma-54 modulation protein